MLFHACSTYAYVGNVIAQVQLNFILLISSGNRRYLGELPRLAL
jgi:hypothetical protein